MWGGVWVNTIYQRPLQNGAGSISIIYFRWLLLSKIVITRRSGDMVIVKPELLRESDMNSATWFHLSGF